jgi:hypothetical protein
VPYDLVPVGPGSDPYPPEARWAEPREADAAAAMRDIYEASAASLERARHGQRTIARWHRPEARSKFLTHRIEHGARQARVLRIPRNGFQNAVFCVIASEPVAMARAKSIERRLRPPRGNAIGRRLCETGKQLVSRGR